MKNIINSKFDSEYKYFIHDSIAYIVFMLIGVLLLMIGIEEPISIILIFSFIIIMLKAASAVIFIGTTRKIIMATYWILFSITTMGLILSIFNVEPNGYIFDKVIIKKDSIGFVTNIKIEQNGDEYNTKLLKPTITNNSKNDTIDVIYKKDNKEIMYQLYSTNIGLHIFYVGSIYLYMISILLFLVITIGFIVIPMIQLMIEKIKENKK